MLLETTTSSCWTSRYAVFWSALQFLVVMLGTSFILPQLLESFSMSDEEVEIFAARLRLQPGMTLCEMGSASGALLSRLAAKVMPGGKLIATNIDTQALAETRTVVIGAGYDASILTTYLATPDAWAPGLADGTDFLWKSTKFLVRPIARLLGSNRPSQDAKVAKCSL